MAYDTYDPYESRSTFGLVALVAVVVICGGLLFWVARYFTSSDEQSAGGRAAEEPEEVVRVLGRLSDPPDQEATAPPETSSEILNSLGIGVSAANPALLVEQIGRNLEAGHVRAAANMIGRKALTEDQFDQLQKLAQDAQLKLNMKRPISEIGELELNKRARWALNLEDDYGSRIYLDLLRKQGKWAVQKVSLPKRAGEGEPSRAVLVDALGITDAFLQAVLGQSFTIAKSVVNPAEVSHAKIAGLSIAIEYWDYNSRPQARKRVA